MNKIEVLSPCNLFGRTANIFNQKISLIKENIWISKDELERECNAKSLLGLLSLGIKKGEKITIKTDSEDYLYIFTLIKKYMSDVS